jgi:hypothetical protein
VFSSKEASYKQQLTDTRMALSEAQAAKATLDEQLARAIGEMQARRQEAADASEDVGRWQADAAALRAAAGEAAAARQAAEAAAAAAAAGHAEEAARLRRINKKAAEELEEAQVRVRGCACVWLSVRGLQRRAWVCGRPGCTVLERA